MSHPPEYNACVSVLKEKYGEVEVMSNRISSEHRMMKVKLIDSKKIAEFDMHVGPEGDIIPSLERSVAVYD